MYELYQEQRTGLPSKFERFRQEIELTEKQKEKIISSHRNLRENNLKTLSYITESFLTGSYKKSTMVRPPNDVDIFLLINQTTHNATPNTVLNRLKRDLARWYPNSKIRQDKPCVVLDFNHCKFELTPAVRESSLWGGYTYYIPDLGGNDWLNVEDPRKLEKRLSSKNRELNGMLTPLIKMMKIWKLKNNIKNIRSYELEERAIDSISRVTSFRDGVEQLLRIYDWPDSNRIFSDPIRSMTDQEFALYCRRTLFGNAFPR